MKFDVRYVKPCKCLLLFHVLNAIKISKEKAQLDFENKILRIYY